MCLPGEGDEQASADNDNPEYERNHSRHSAEHPGVVARQYGPAMNRVVPDDCQQQDRDFKPKRRVEIVMVRIGGKQQAGRKKRSRPSQSLSRGGSSAISA